MDRRTTRRGASKIPVASTRTASSSTPPNEPTTTGPRVTRKAASSGTKASPVSSVEGSVGSSNVSRVAPNTPPSSREIWRNGPPTGPLDSTPMKISSSGHGSVHSGPNAEPPARRYQVNLKERMWDELHEKIGEVKVADLPPHMFPVTVNSNSASWKKIQRKLKGTFFPSPHDSDMIKGLKGAQTKAEHLSYPHLVEVLNKILQLIEDNSSKGDLGPIGISAFRVYDREVRGTIDSISGDLKPDILWLIDELAARQRTSEKLTDSLYWGQIFGTGEVKGHDPAMIQQNATYARALMSMGRLHTTTFVYNHKTSAFRFCFHLPFGMYLTETLDITQFQGLEAIAKILHDMSRMTRYQLGFHPFLELADYKMQRFALPDHGILKWATMTQLCRRVGAVGRQTLAGQLSVAEEDANQLVHNVQKLKLRATARRPPQDIVTFRRGFLREVMLEQEETNTQELKSLEKQTSTGPSKLPEFSSKSANEFVNDILGNQHGDILQRWMEAFEGVDQWGGVLRRSYPTVQHVDIEMAALNAASGMHGHAEYYVMVRMDHSYNEWHQTKLERVEILVGKPVYNASKTGSPIEVDQRTELVVYTPTVGESLEECDAPWMLVRCLLDCLIGLANWFHKGYSHRDVSSGNLLRRMEKEDRTGEEIADKTHEWFKDKEDMGFLQVYLQECYAFIIDADLVVRWRDHPEPGKDRSGTVPFLPTRNLEAWRDNKSILHTTIDDLQSFAWVLLWIAFRKDPEHPASKRSMEGLSRDSFGDVLNQKSALMKDLTKDWVVNESYPASVQVIRDLFNKWITISDNAEEDLYKLCTDDKFTIEKLHRGPKVEEQFNARLEAMTKKFLKKYMQAAVDFLETPGMESMNWPT